MKSFTSFRSPSASAAVNVLINVDTEFSLDWADMLFQWHVQIPAKLNKLLP